jgi:hypothetical protein
MKHVRSYSLVLTLALCGVPSAAAQSAGDSNARPPVTKADIEIVKRARQILDSPAKWNRADTRRCPADAKTFSIYCALQRATGEVTGNFEHRAPAMQEARFVIEAIAPAAKYDHRLMGYNNDPKTTFADIQNVFNLLEQSIAKRLAEQPVNPAATPAPRPQPVVTKADVEVLRRTRAILDSPEKWNRDRTQNCPADATTFNLYCALAKADREVNGEFHASCPAINEVKRLIDETVPQAKTYHARLVEYNAEPATTLAGVQKLLLSAEQRLSAQLADQRR